MGYGTVHIRSARKKISVVKGLDGGRTKDRTWDPFDVNEVLSR